ncbi:hypothetical protein CL634_08140 [bacterium]|nr:hypothetical protein [bacterium]
MSLELIFLSSTIFASILLCVSIYFNIKHGLIIVKFTESLEESLDIMDERYAKINEVLDTPLFHDSPQIRQVLDEVRNCRDSILLSANILTNNNIETFEDEN